MIHENRNFMEPTEPRAQQCEQNWHAPGRHLLIDQRGARQRSANPQQQLYQGESARAALIRDMTRLLLFFFVGVVLYQNGTFGKAVYGDPPPTEVQEYSDTDYPDGKTESKRASDQVIRNADSPNSSEHASLCYFVQESEIESQISCRLRFTRSKFNFNPFGLRFGKREPGSPVSKRDPTPVSRIILPYLLALKEGRRSKCGHPGNDC
ncbi:hypothetical protein NDU88_005338 [Pleurodeles waltl]|uniref:Uncharacterized protein n=1 Tax=Pleurodeles waltl TaxID=8319 RepID=A0AAV7SLH6_PLEWA|nr:hypothetical protein NDU88_005338 [Pleurodeles waltl]